MKNIVVITREYYPQMTPVSAVVDKYIQRLKGKYKFHVICTSYQKNIPPLNDSFLEIHPIYTNLSLLRGWCEKKYDQHKGNWFYKFLINLFRLRSALWLLKSYSAPTEWERRESEKMLNQLSKQVDISTVISVSGSLFHAHLAAKKYKENHPQTKWLTFITDPITFLDSNFFLFKSKKMMEKSYETELSIYNSADYNVLIGDTYYDVIEKFKQPIHKTLHFNLTLDDIRKDIAVENVVPHDDVRIIYAGAFYRKIRNPQYMLSVMSKIEGIRLDLFVSSHDCVDIILEYQSDRIVLHKSVETQKYKEMICNGYDILLNVGNSCTNQMPSKMLELLSTGRPILNFYFNKDSQYEMIEKYPLGLNVGMDDVDAVNKVDDFCKRMKGKQISYDEVKSLYPESVIDQQLDILEMIL